jgi:uncharacterized membrane protein
MNTQNRVSRFNIQNPKELLFVTVWVFVFFSIFGYLFEVSVSLITIGTTRGHQGILYLPMTPIYGFGFLLMLIIYSRIKHLNLWVQYLICSVTGGLFEILCSLIEINFYHSRSWDYSNLPLNIYGYTTIPYAMVWGLLGFSFMRLWPTLRKQLMKLKTEKTRIFTQCVLIFILADAVLSTAICVRAAERANNIPADNVLEEWMDIYFPDELIRDQWPGMKY